MNVAVAIPICINQVLTGLIALWVADVPVDLRTIDGTVIHGRYAGVDQSGALRLAADGQVRAYGLDELSTVVFSRQTGSIDRPPGTVTFHLSPRGICRGKITAQAEAGIEISTPFGRRLVVDFEHLTAVRLAQPGDSAKAAQVFAAELAGRLPGKDVLITRSSEQVKTVRGTLLSLGPDGGRFVFNQRERTFKNDDLYGIILARGTELTDSHAGLIHLDDGGQLPATLLPSDAGRVVAKTVFGSPLVLPVERVRSIEFTSDRVVYLSDLAPARQDVRGLLHQPWPVRTDRSAGNSKLRIDGRSFDKGLGVHARTELTYALDGRFERFLATIGIDDAVRPRGHVVFRVLGNDRVLFDSGPVTGKDPARDIKIDLSGVAKLTLLVDYGEQMDLADHADWADARLIKPAG